MKLNEQFPQLEQKDVSQIVLPLLQHEGMEAPVAPGTNVLYHAACHCEWAGVPTLKGQAQLTGALEQLCKVKVSTIPGCCGESGMGAVTSPTIYNLLRARKKERLAQAFEPQPQTGACYAGPILVGGPPARSASPAASSSSRKSTPCCTCWNGWPTRWTVRTAASASAAAPTRPAATCASSSARRE